MPQRKAKHITAREFDGLMAALGVDWTQHAALSVGVSGGPDSLALGWLLHQWARRHRNFPSIHILSVDHGLRPGSAREVAQVAKIAGAWPGVRHAILTWKGKKPQAAIQQRARAARYQLMRDHCAAQGITMLCLAHHQQDQAETVLLRLAGGSGLSGLCGMRAVQPVAGGMTLLRPLLGLPKERLVATCQKHKLKFVEDPSNFLDKFARVRLRQAWQALEREGLSAKRLARTAERLARADQALEKYEKDAFDRHIYIRDTKCIVYNMAGLLAEPREIVFRLLVHAIESLRPEADFLPRMEKLEHILDDLLAAAPFRKRTLGGLVFEKKEATGHVSIAVQPPQRPGKKAEKT